MPTFSIVIPAYNEEKYLRETLHSIKQQSYQNFETIVVANGCTDKTEEIAKKRANIRVLSLPKANVSVARNAGALNANGEILLFLDADTTLEKDSLKKIKVEFTDKYSVAATRVKPDLKKIKYKLAMSFKNFHNRTGIYKGNIGILICRKKDFKKIEGYDPELIIMEHNRLKKRLMELGKYKCINSYVTTSTRRYQQWGLSKTVYYWVRKGVEALFDSNKEKDYEKIR